MHRPWQEPHRLSGESCYRRRHRLHAGERTYSRVRQARRVRARPQAAAGRRRQHACAAAAQQRGRVQAVLAGRHADLCASVAAVPQPERRLPRSQ